jgi:putative transcriptional regulator
MDIGYGITDLRGSLPMKNRIKELRARNNLTQQKLSQIVGVRRETIVFLEKGKYNPSLALAYSIAKVFQLPIEEVFLFDEEESDENA